MNFLKPLFTFGYWFSYGVVPMMPAVSRALLVFMSGLVIVGVAIAIYAKFQKGMDKTLRRIAKRMAAMSFTAGLTGLLLSWFYYEGIAVFSARFMYLIWLAIFGWWKWEIIRDYKRAKAGEMSAAERANYEKWLPKPKH
jgi:hypothetical protein